MHKLEKQTPNFVFNDVNALFDMGCIISDELPEVMPNKRYVEKVVRGRSGSLIETYDDYEPFDFKIKNVSIPYDNLTDVKRWLSRPGKLISHNDADKYYQATPTMSAPLEFEQEWGFFYTFDIVFRCQPFKQKLNDSEKDLTPGMNEFENSGDLIARPLITFKGNKENITLTIGSDVFVIYSKGMSDVTLDCKLGTCVSGKKLVKTKGNFPKLKPRQWNSLTVSGTFTQGKIKIRSEYL